MSFPTKTESCRLRRDVLQPARPPVPAVFAVRLLGRVAARALRSNVHWEVMAVFRRSFYCQGRSGALVCFGPRSLGAGPLNILCDTVEWLDWEARLPTRGASAAGDGSLFRVGERLAFSLVGAEEWRPAVPVRSWEPATLIQGLAMLAREVRSRPARGGFQTMIPMFAGHATTSADADPLVGLALTGIGPLANWLQTSVARPAEPVPVPISAIDGLIGLGPGLTPSGDDFLAGVLLALHHLGASGLASCLAPEVLSRAEHRTNAISRAHLAAAADGEGAAALHVLLTSLSTPGAPGMLECMSDIDALGHSSGWDAVAGISWAAAGLALASAGHSCAAASV
jgi:hypothetical protein